MLIDDKDLKAAVAGALASAEEVVANLPVDSLAREQVRQLAGLRAVFHALRKSRPQFATAVEKVMKDYCIREGLPAAVAELLLSDEPGTSPDALSDAHQQGSPTANVAERSKQKHESVPNSKGRKN